MFFSKPKTYLGVDIGAGGMKMVELKKEKNRPVLTTYALSSERQDVHRLALTPDKTMAELSGEPTPKPLGDSFFTEENAEHYAKLLRHVARQARVSSKTATVSLPVSAVFHAAVNLPVAKKEESLPILKAEVKKLLPRPIDEMVLDYQLLPGDDRGKTQIFLINAVPRSVVAFYTMIFKKAGWGLEALEPESVALERSLVGKDNALSMVVDIGLERSNFFIIENGAVATHSSIEMGGGKVSELLNGVWNLDESLVEQAKYDVFNYLINSHFNAARGRFYELTRSIIDPIVKEIEYSFDLYLRQTSSVERTPEKIILAGGASVLPFLPEIIAEKFKLKCYLGDPWGRVIYQDGLKPVLSRNGPRLAVAIGLALRGML